ncbi:hypothetical protein [Azospirillum halopraeferens]|uniref:hypothetical protein n=1 Tax=Azospirillum halopraeferens TaxID=34010 RepID=UPI00040D3611|nr:hypothetical protein [Azospirillum halopraeferens]
MWQTYTQAIILALSFSVVALGIAKAVVIIGERRIERRYGLVGIRDVLARRARLEQGLEARRTERLAELKAADAAVQEAIMRRQQLDRRLSDTLRGGEPVIRLIGDEVAGSPCFVALVVNKYVGTGTGPSATIDPSWAQPQTVEVWAAGLPEARKEIERRYPQSFGYAVTRIQQYGAGPPVKGAA